jgi:hypothetical protein
MLLLEVASACSSDSMGWKLQQQRGSQIKKQFDVATGCSCV